MISVEKNVARPSYEEQMVALVLTRLRITAALRRVSLCCTQLPPTAVVREELDVFDQKVRVLTSELKIFMETGKGRESFFIPEHAPVSKFRRY